MVSTGRRSLLCLGTGIVCDFLSLSYFSYSSLCHPWAAGATRWLTDNVLGLRATTPGFTTYEFAPYLGIRMSIMCLPRAPHVQFIYSHVPCADNKSLRFVSGSVLTPRGPLHASLDLSLGQMYVKAPQGSIGDVSIPKLQRRIFAVYEQSVGLVYAQKAPTSSALFASVQEDGTHLHLRGLPAGEYNFTIKFATEQSRAPPASETSTADGTYAAKFLGSDLTTQGSWQTGGYGSLGYALLSCHAPGAHITSLPSFVSGIDSSVPATDTNCYIARNLTWASSTTDFRALQDPTSTGGSRCIGALASQLNGSLALGQSFHVDVNVAPSNTAWFRVSLYFVDFDLRDRRSMVQTYDGVGKQIVAPWQQVSTYGGGVYLSYAYNQSIRFRMNFIRGDDAVLSAIFFDSFSN